MSKRKACWFMLDLELADRLDAMKSRTGLSIAEQIRRAIKFWLESQEWPIARKRTHAGGPHVD